MEYKGPFNDYLPSEQDLTVNKLRDYIAENNFKPNDRLPAERKLSEQLGISRNQVREAIRKLEFYGLLKTLPQSGTIVASMGVSAIDGMITEVLRLDKPDFRSLVETRIILESNAVGLAAVRRSNKQLVMMEEALEEYAAKAEKGTDALEEDLNFHLKIAESTGNAVINTLMLIITPEIIKNFEKFHVCDKKQTRQGIEEHQAIFDAIVAKDAEQAREALRQHFGNLYQYCYDDYDVADFKKLII